MIIDWMMVWIVTLSIFVAILMLAVIALTRGHNKLSRDYLECRKRLNNLTPVGGERIGRRLACQGREVKDGVIKKRPDFDGNQITYIDDEAVERENRRFDKIVAGDEPF